MSLGDDCVLNRCDLDNDSVLNDVVQRLLCLGAFNMWLIVACVGLSLMRLRVQCWV